MVRIVIGALLIAIAAAFDGGMAFTPLQGSFDEFAGGMTMMPFFLLLPGVLLLHFGLRSRGRQPHPAWIAIAMGAGLVLAGAIIIAKAPHAAEPISTGKIVLFNVLGIWLGTILLAFAALALFAPRLAGAKAMLIVLGIPTAVTVATTMVAMKVNARHREATVAGLQSSDPVIRADAVRALAAAEATPPSTIALLEDADDSVRLAAIDTVRKTGDPAAVPALARIVDSDSGSARFWRLREQARSDTAPPEVRASAMKEMMVMEDGRSGAQQDAMKIAAADALAYIRDGSGALALERPLARRDLAVVAGAHRYFIGKGVAGSEPVLIDALRAHGSKQMGEVLLNSGNATLKIAAEAWAKEHGYEIKHPFVPADAIAWGGRK